MSESTVTIQTNEARDSLFGAAALLAEGWVAELLSGVANSLDDVFLRAGGDESGLPTTDRNLPGYTRLIDGDERSRLIRAQLLRAIADQIELSDHNTEQDDFEAAMSDEIGDALAIASVRFLIRIAKGDANHGH